MSSVENRPQVASSRPVGRARRRELLSLRERASALEAQLVALRREQGRHDAGSAGGSAWQAVATCQRARRQRAITENARLRHLLSELLRVRTQLARLISHQRETADVIAATSESSESMGSDAAAQHNTEIFVRLVEDVVSAYADLARVLRLAALPSTTRQLDLVQHPLLGVVLQSVEAHALPLSWQIAASEIWQMIPELLATRRDQILCRELVGDNRMHLKFNLDVQTPTDRVRLHVVTVSQRFTTPERTVIIFASRLEATESTDPALQGMRIRHRTSLVLAPMELPSGYGFATKGTAVSTVVPEWDEMVASISRQDAVTNFLESVIPKELTARHHQVEDHLLRRQALVAVT